MTIAKFFELYRQSRLRGVSDSTIDTYLLILSLFWQWSVKTADRPPNVSDLTPPVANAYLDDLLHGRLDHRQPRQPRSRRFGMDAELYGCALLADAL